MISTKLFTLIGNQLVILERDFPCSTRTKAPPVLRLFLYLLIREEEFKSFSSAEAFYQAEWF
jgi:hypothetical protein